LSATRVNATDQTLILDSPPSHSMSTTLYFPTAYQGGASDPETYVNPFALKIEIGKIHFDHADFIPNPGVTDPRDYIGSNFTLRLTSAGKTAYEMTNVWIPQDGHGGTLSVSKDTATGYDYVAYTKVA
jgi:hypothetical protein